MRRAAASEPSRFPKGAFAHAEQAEWDRVVAAAGIRGGPGPPESTAAPGAGDP